MPCGLCLIFVEAFLVEHQQLGRGLSYPLTTLVLPCGSRVEMWGLPRTSDPEASTKDTAGPGPHRAGEAVCNIYGERSGAVGRKAKGQPRTLSYVQYLCYFLDEYFPKHLFMQ